MKATGFSSLEGMIDYLKYLERCSEEADQDVQPWQANIKPGDYYLLEAPDDGLTIIGKVLPPGNYAFYRSRRGRNYRFVKAFSVCCPEGELGDVHVSEISAVISKKRFERIKESIQKEHQRWKLSIQS